MSFVLEFDAQNNILRGAVEGGLTDAIFLDYYGVAAKYTASHPPCRGIWDLSKVTTFDVSSQFLRQLAEMPQVIPAGYLRVVVAPHDLLYGMMRMLQILTEKTRPDLHVVRTIEEAYHLLHAESPEFRPVS